MATATNYSKAPITEAIIQLLVKPAAGIGLKELARAFDCERQAYPNRKDIKVARSMFEVGSRLSATASSEHVGYVHSNLDETQVLQTSADSFAFSRLAPYESWQSFRDEARRLWTIFRERLKPAAVSRLAVRFVNRLDVPNTRFTIDDYLRTRPEIAPNMPQTLAGYFMQLQLPMEDIQSTLLLNETTGLSPIAGCTGLILDIDLFRADDIPQDEEGIWGVFEVLRGRKNHVFEACITDRTRELFR